MTNSMSTDLKPCLERSDQARENDFDIKKAKNELKIENYSKVSSAFYDYIKTDHLEDFNKFQLLFQKLPKVGSMNDGLESGEYNFKTCQLMHGNIDKYKKYGLERLECIRDTINNNSFVNNLLDPIFRTFVDDPETDRIEVIFMMHRRSIQAQRIEKLDGIFPHNDGDDTYGTVVIKVAQENMTGGENRLFDNKTPQMLTGDTIPNNGDIILLYNQNIRHQLTDMSLINQNFPGHRDAIVINIKRI